MSDKTLGKARGLNSIADPKSFKGSAGRARVTEAKPPRPAPPSRSRVEPAEPATRSPSSPTPAPPEDRTDADRPPEPDERSRPRSRKETVDPGGKRSRRDSKGEGEGAPERGTRPAAVEADVEREPFVAEPAPVAQPHRAVTPGIQRKRRELSVPHVLAEALERTGINPADIVMAGYRKHGDAIYAGSGGRMLAKGRTRLRLSISDIEFEQLTRLGQARGWNRSETVSVILAMELMAPTEPAD